MPKNFGKLQLLQEFVENAEFRVFPIAVRVGILENDAALAVLAVPVVR